MGGKVRVCPLEWGDISRAQALGSAPFDLVLVSDCVHWPELFDPLFQTLKAVIGENTQCLISYEVRNETTEKEFFNKLRKEFVVYKLGANELHPRFRADE